MKCKLCNNEIETTFLNKIKGTVVKIKDNNKVSSVYVCRECQIKNKNLKQLLS